MMEETSIQKSLVEQILDEMFADIEGRDVFDKQVIQKLRQLAESGDLKKPANVIKVIKSASGRKP
jgi:phosphoenolpyruvate carboxylase